MAFHPDPTNPRDAFNVTQLGIQGLQNVGNQASGFANQLFDPQSQFFQNFRSFLGSVTPTTGTNQFLAQNVASGSNFAQGGVFAKEQQRAAERRRTDFLNTTVRGFASSAIGAGTNLLGLAGQTAGQIGNIGLGLRGADIQQSGQEAGFLDFLLPIAGGTAGFFIGGPPGAVAGFGAGGGFGGGASASPANPQPSDIKLKENIEYTGENTTNGVPIVMFSFIGNKRRFRGVIAQDAEKIVPDAVIEINGIKYVNYGRL